MSHIDPAMFAGVGAVVLIVLYGLRSRDWAGAFWWAAPTIIVGGLLAAWWALPFYLRFPYVTDMGYGRITTFINTLFPASDTWLFILAGIGAALSLARRRRLGEFLAIMTLLAAVAFRYMPQSILWNARVLPFWFLGLYLLAGLAVAELCVMAAERAANFTVTLRAALLPAPLVALVLALLWVGFPLRILPGEKAGANGQVQWLGVTQKTESDVPGWVTWNYSGYQYGCPNDCAKPRWPEYQQIISQVEKVSKTYGCGNLMWEYNSTMNDYGTPDALTVLPYWTNGCIGSMEGLYYEASATTPFHFIDQSELSLQPSDPMVFPDGLQPYAGQANGGGAQPDVALGVQHLQILGVKYYMAINPPLQEQAAADPSLKLISTFGPFPVNYGSTNAGGPTGTQEQRWKLYLVLGAPQVHPLADQPVVMQGLNNASQPKWLKVMVPWYNDPSSWDVYIAATGPSNWKRAPYGATDLPVTPEPSTTVSDVVEHNSSISFNVSRLGVPVVVTTSYFPNWVVSGAQGVYRVSPNLMVVVPTSHHVRLSYANTPVDYTGWALTVLALIGLVVLARRPQAAMAAVRRSGLGGESFGNAFSRPPWAPWAGGEEPPWPYVQPDGPGAPAPDYSPARDGFSGRSNGNNGEAGSPPWEGGGEPAGAETTGASPPPPAPDAEL